MLSLIYAREYGGSKVVAPVVRRWIYEETVNNKISKKLKTTTCGFSYTRASTCLIFIIVHNTYIYIYCTHRRRDICTYQCMHLKVTDFYACESTDVYHTKDVCRSK